MNYLTNSKIAVFIGKLEKNRRGKVWNTDDTAKTDNKIISVNITRLNACVAKFIHFFFKFKHLVNMRAKRLTPVPLVVRLPYIMFMFMMSFRTNNIGTV